MKAVACLIAVSCCFAAVMGQGAWDTGSGSGSALGSGSGLGGSGLFGGGSQGGMGGMGGMGPMGGMGGMFGSPLMKMMMFRNQMDMNFLPAMLMSGLMGGNNGGQGSGGMGMLWPMIMMNGGF